MLTAVQSWSQLPGPCRWGGAAHPARLLHQQHADTAHCSTGLGQYLLTPSVAAGCCTAGERDLGTVLLSLSADLMAFDFTETFTDPFEVANKVSGICVSGVGWAEEG